MAGLGLRPDGLEKEGEEGREKKIIKSFLFFSDEDLERIFIKINLKKTKHLRANQRKLPSNMNATIQITFTL